MYEVAIVDLAPLRVAAIQHHGDYQLMSKAFEKLAAAAATQGLLTDATRTLGIYHDDPKAAALPRVPRALIGRLARTGVRKAVRCQGLGRHSLAEQKRFLARDLDAISNAVEHAGFIAGPRMTVFDLAIAAQISSMLDNVPATWATDVASEFPSLEDYAERVQQATGTYGREPANYGRTVKRGRPALSALAAPSDV